MAGKRITSLNTLTGANTATIDVLPIVDVSAGEAKQITTQELSNALVTINGGLQGGFGVYTNTTLGLANTANGGYFFVPSANTGESLSMYQDVGGTAVYITGIPEFNTTENPYGGLSRIDGSGILGAFVYDTTQDSDGGEWRKKCQHTSWYNEQLNTATRGSRREFPEKALFIYRETSFYIYDLDSGDAEMWMYFSGNYSGALPYSGPSGPVSGIAAKNGLIMVSASLVSQGGVTILDFIKDFGVVMIHNTTGYWPRPIALRGASSSGLPQISFYYPRGLVERGSNCIAMDVRPGTPPNKERFGLPNPTIAVGSDSGISIIHWDKRVTYITWTTYSIVKYLAFRPTDKALYAVIDSAITSGRWRHVYHQLPINDIANGGGYVGSSSVDEYYSAVYSAAYTGVSFPLFHIDDASLSYSQGTNGLYDVTPVGIVSFLPESSNSASGSRAIISNTYNSGYQTGNATICLSESTNELTSLVETTVLDDDFSSYASNAALSLAWVPVNDGVDTSVTLSGGGMRVESLQQANYGKVFRGFSTEIGKSYTLRIDNLASGNSSVGFYSVSTGFNTGSYKIGTILANTTSYISFIARTSITYVGLYSSSSANTGNTFYSVYDNVSVGLSVSDRSIRETPVTVKGNISRTAVATGAELACYSGFGTNNYLEVPYDTGHDFGTEDFYLSGWVNGGTVGRTIIGRGDTSNTDPGWIVYYASDGAIEFYTRASTTNTKRAESVTPLNTVASWNKFDIIRRSGTLEIWINGKNEASVAGVTTDLTNTNAVMRIGQSIYSDGAFINGKLALLKVSKTTPTPEMIRTMYERESVLFTANTKCLAPALLHTSISYDEEYDVVYCTTSLGTYTLKGIQVLDKVIDNNIVYSGIVASGNITSKWTATGANTYIPSIYPFRSEINKTPRKTYDRNKVKTRTYTTSATPKVIYHIPFDEGEEGTFITRTIGVNRDDGTQIGSYEHKYTARRVNGSANVDLIGSTNTVIQEVTSSMDVTVSNGNNYITLTYTGLASNTIEWTSYTEGTFNDF